MTTEPDFYKFDHSELLAFQDHAYKIIDFQLTTQPPPSLLSSPSPSSGFKPPRMETPRWSGKSYKFYTWLSAHSRNFDAPQCPKAARTQLMLQAMPLDAKLRLSFNNKYAAFINWTLAISRALLSSNSSTSMWRT